MKSLFTGLVLILAAAQSINADVRTSKHKVFLQGELKGFKAELTSKNIEQGLDIVTLKLSSDTEQLPPALKLAFSHPAKDIQAHWHPAAWFNRIGMYDWQRNDGKGYFSSGTNDAPVFSLFNTAGENRLTFAASEILYPVYMNAGIDERKMTFDCFVSIFDIPTKPIKDYTVMLRLDTRAIKYYKAIDDVQNWWQKTSGFVANEAGDAATLPLYSTWYSYHQVVSAAEVEKELELAAEIGCKVVITDDGWQTDIDGANDYYGDWEPGPKTFPDLKAHIAKAQAMGFKYMMWYALPFVGEKSRAYADYKDKLLYYVPWARSWVLDPRYPEIRRHIIQTYIDAIKEYNVDGFKLDFIDRFNTRDAKNAPYKEGMDYKSVEEAADVLMTDIMTSLKAVKPDILIEFRQHYIGPLMRKYGNMLRAHDCPYASIENRMKILDVRTLSGNTAVHSDMVIWNYSEPVEAAALQIENVIFSVPQVSVRLAEISDSQRKMVKFLLKVYVENRDVLLRGELDMQNPEQYYTRVSATTNDKQFVALYNDMPAILADKAKIIVMNATGAKRVILDIPKDLGERKVAVYACTGDKVFSEKVNLSAGIKKTNVPPSGLIIIDK